MKERNTRRWYWALCVPMLCALLLTAGQGRAAQEGEDVDSAAPAVTKKFRGRLPAYFSALVSTDQRKKVYEIQETYYEKIVALEEQIAKLKGDRDKDVDGVLTPEQLVEVTKKRDTAAAKRRSRRAAPEEASDGSEMASSDE